MWGVGGRQTNKENNAEKKKKKKLEKTTSTSKTNTMQKKNRNTKQNEENKRADWLGEKAETEKEDGRKHGKDGEWKRTGSMRRRTFNIQARVIMRI